MGYPLFFMSRSERESQCSRYAVSGGLLDLRADARDLRLEAVDHRLLLAQLLDEDRRDVGVSDALGAGRIGLDDLRHDALDLLGDEAHLAAARRARIEASVRSPVAPHAPEFQSLREGAFERRDVGLEPRIRDADDAAAASLADH